jgi:uncharacterized membrane protein
MPDPNDLGVPSTAAIAGHPIHPMLVVFPIAFLLGALATDLAGWLAGDPFWARASFWLLAAGVAGGVLAAVAGLTDFVTRERVHRLGVAWMHMVGNAAVLIIAAVNLALHWTAPGRVDGLEVVLAAVAAGMLAITGWLGGEMVYRHGFGMELSAGELDLDTTPRSRRFGRRPHAG